MSQAMTVDGLLVQWGDRFLYPGNRMVKDQTQPRLRGGREKQRAALVRRRICALLERKAPQVMVKVTGGGRGLKAIAAHFRYIGKNGRRELEDELGQKLQGKEALGDLINEWRLGGSFIDDVSHRREAFNLMLSMPRGTDPSIVLKAAREFAQTEFANHKYVMVLHDHQANPHVHLSVRAESRNGHRMNPRKADLRRWRETFAEKLQGWGIEAGASSRFDRGAVRGYQALWRIKAKEQGRLRDDMKGAMLVQIPNSQEKVGRHGLAVLAAVLARTEPGSSDYSLALEIRSYLNEKKDPELERAPGFDTRLVQSTEARTWVIPPQN
ncbi:hypothetical protein DBR47_24195, partial [Paucibacter sp. KBW04]|uniref:relaxase/mobilization nuclease domain-containing protein n=1 Tax=Paucibacter sp. KBW04 TaxID=2153361 RepID=UPI000F55FEA0